MLSICIRYIVITAIIYEQIYAIDENEWISHSFGNDENLAHQLSYYTASMLCNFRVNLVHVYYETNLTSNIAETLIIMMSKCTSIMVVRYVF